jgi:hypothetical protein
MRARISRTAAWSLTCTLWACNISTDPIAEGNVSDSGLPPQIVDGEGGAGGSAPAERDADFLGFDAGATGAARYDGCDVDLSCSAGCDEDFDCQEAPPSGDAGAPPIAVDCTDVGVDASCEGVQDAGPNGPVLEPFDQEAVAALEFDFDVDQERWFDLGTRAGALTVAGGFVEGEGVLRAALCGAEDTVLGRTAADAGLDDLGFLANVETSQTVRLRVRLEGGPAKVWLTVSQP